MASHMFGTMFDTSMGRNDFNANYAESWNMNKEVGIELATDSDWDERDLEYGTSIKKT